MLRVERDGDILLWTVARPAAKNALDRKTMEALAAAVAEAARDRSVRAVVLTGEGDAFVSGGDLRELRAATTREDAEAFADAGSALCRAFSELDIPLIAALPGVAFGGGAELAVACDLRVAEARARVSFKQVRLGVTTAWGSIERLVALVGRGAAARLLYTAAEVSAAEAQAMGLVDAVCADGASLATALAWAQEIARGSPAAVAAMKRLLRPAPDVGEESVAARERASFVETWTGADHDEAMAAYFEKRPPRWR